MLKWKKKEFFSGIFGRIQDDEITKFLNTLPEERALEAKVFMFNTFGFIWYRTDEEIEEPNELPPIPKADRIGLHIGLGFIGIIVAAFLVSKLFVWFVMR